MYLLIYLCIFYLFTACTTAFLSSTYIYIRIRGVRRSIYRRVGGQGQRAFGWGERQLLECTDATSNASAAGVLQGMQGRHVADCSWCHM